MPTLEATAAALYCSPPNTEAQDNRTSRCLTSCQAKKDNSATGLYLCDEMKQTEPSKRDEEKCISSKRLIIFRRVLFESKSNRDRSRDRIRDRRYTNRYTKGNSKETAIDTQTEHKPTNEEPNN